MWAFDLEKRQHRFANGELKPLSPGETGLGAGVQKLGETVGDLKDEVAERKDL